jgi:hypothetical protein
MPYISQDRRAFAVNNPETPGELNFAITRILNIYIRRQPWNYQTLNDCLGALEGAKLEFYRRVVVPYEQDKEIENGDVY